MSATMPATPPLDADRAPAAPGAAPDALPSCGSPILPAFSRAAMVSAPRAESGAYENPGDGARNALAASIARVAAGRFDEARSDADAAGFELCAGRPPEDDLVAWRPREPARGGAFLALRWRRARSLIVQAPHPFFDAGTLEEAAVIFARLQARALLASGTHRCASARTSGCDGVTAACGGAEAPVRESDMAHNHRTLFQAAHVALAEAFASDVVLSVHGMADDGISLSDGSGRPQGERSAVARAAAALSAAFPGERVTTCNAYPGAAAVEQRLCAGTNVQGRHLNGSPNACQTAAPRSSGRFLHMEQSRRIRDAADTVAGALQAAFDPP